MKITVEFESQEYISDEVYERRLMSLLSRIKNSKYTIINKINSNEITFDLIEQKVLDHTGLTKEQLHLKSRDRDIADARKICYYLSKKFKLGSCRIIGKRFGNKDHSTAYNGWQKTTYFLKTDVEFKKKHKIFIESFFNEKTI